MIRKTLIYKTGVEYGDYTLNHVLGCAHGCKYPCYAFMMAKRFGKVKDYQDWISPKIVENTMELLDQEIPKYKDKIKILNLCFTTDPFMYGYPEIIALSEKIIKKANDSGVRCSVLTKGILPESLAKLPMKNEYGITIVSLDEAFTRKYEPGAAPVADRLRALKHLSEAGCSTWVSIEPYPTPNMLQQDLIQLLEAVSFTDRIIFGRLHYNKVVSEYADHKHFYNTCANTVIEFCQAHNIAFHIKTGTITKEED